MKKAVSWVMSLIFVVSISGCSFFADSTQSFTVTTSEKDAEIFFNGKPVGTGQVTKDVKRNENIAVLVKKDGYQTASRNVSKKLSSIGIIDVVGAVIWLVPIAGLFAPGAWELDKSVLSINLEKK